MGPEMFYLYAYMKMHDGGSKVAVVTQDEDPYNIVERMCDEMGLGLELMYAIFTGVVMVDDSKDQIEYEDMLKRVTPEEDKDDA